MALFNKNDSTSVVVVFNNNNNILLQNGNDNSDNDPAYKYSLNNIFTSPIEYFFVHLPVIPVFFVQWLWTY